MCFLVICNYVWSLLIQTGFLFFNFCFSVTLALLLVSQLNIKYSACFRRMETRGIKLYDAAKIWALSKYIWVFVWLALWKVKEVSVKC